MQFAMYKWKETQIMEHAFIIVAHKNFNQIKLLIDSLKFGDVYLHVDIKNESLYNLVEEYYRKSNNVFIIKDRMNINWSGLSQVLTTLKIMKIIGKKNKKYDYIHLISGQDMLVVNKEGLDDFLLSYGKDCIFMDYKDIGMYRWRVKRFSFFRENPNNRKIMYKMADRFLRLLQLFLPERKNLKGYNLFMGSSWFSITNECLEYINNNAGNLLSDFNKTSSPDEHFFQILILNSELKHKVINNNGRYVRFKKYHSSPDILTKEDYSVITNGNYIFARKFDIEVDEEIIYKLLKLK